LKDQGENETTIKETVPLLLTILSLFLFVWLIFVTVINQSDDSEHEPTIQQIEAERQFVEEKQISQTPVNIVKEEPKKEESIEAEELTLEQKQAIANARIRTKELEKATIALEAKKYDEVLRIVKPLAEQGITKAQVIMGILYKYGKGVGQDYEKAKEWYEKAAHTMKQLPDVEKNRLADEHVKFTNLTIAEAQELIELEMKVLAWVQHLLSKAQEDINALRLTSPDGNNALEKYNKILELDSENTEAKQGLQNIVDKYIELAKQAANNGEYNKAVANLDKADKILPDSENIKTVREEIELKVKEEEEQRLAELERQRQAEEQKRVEEEKIQIDEKIIIALLADGIDLSELPPVQQEAYVAGKRRELNLKNESRNIQSYINQLENKSSCLRAGSIKWNERGYGLFPDIAITNVCDEKIWTKLYTHISWPTPAYTQDRTATFYTTVVNEPKEAINVQLTGGGVYFSHSRNNKSFRGKVNVNINAFSIPHELYNDSLNDEERLPYVLLHRGKY